MDPDRLPRTEARRRSDRRPVVRPAFHPQVQAVMDAVTIPSFRPELLDRLRAQNTGDPTELLDLGLDREDVVMAGHGGAAVELSVWRSSGRVDDGACAGTCFLALHGGGLVSGDRFAAGGVIADLVAREGGVMVSVEYRLAPEHPAPTPVEDCYAALCWVAEHAADLGVAPGRVVVAGTSAGGGLTAGVLLAARDRGGPGVLGGWLDTPMLDDRGATGSAGQYEDLGLFWDGAANRAAWSLVLPEGYEPTCYDVPARAEDLGGLPPLLVTVGSAEPFRDEAVDLASRVWRDGGSCELLVVPGGTHSYATAVPGADITAVHEEVVRRWIRSLLAPDSPDGAAEAIRSLREVEALYRER